MTTEKFEHDGLIYSVGTWVVKPGRQHLVGWSDRWEGDENPNPAAFAGSAIPPERAGLDLNPVLAAAIGQMLRRVWVLPTSGNIQKLLEEHLGEGGRLELGNPSPRPLVHRLGRSFCTAQGVIRSAKVGTIEIYLLVDRDHDRAAIRLVNDDILKLYAHELT